MCGISALIHRRGLPVDARLVSAMNARVVHRGPDDEGVFQGPSFALGHRRLSVLDLTTAGHQPMALRDRSVVTYNGELYNYVELRNELKTLGYEFQTTTDTEVLLAAYDAWGEQCVTRFNGMWAFVLWDRRRQQLLCSRDRFGVKPLHYVELGDYLALGSEVKQFLDLPGFKVVPDPVSVHRFMVEGVFGVDEREFVEGVRSLRGGHNLVFDLKTGRYAIRRWYDCTQVRAAGRQLSYEDACAQFRDLFFDAVRIRLRSDVRLGICLSGGLDSSAIACAARKVAQSSQNVRTVSCVWDDTTCDESPFIDAVVDAAKYDAVRVRPDMAQLLDSGTLDRLVYHQDQPLLSASQFSEYAVFGAARASGMVVMLDGQGADEYLAGYGWFFPPFIRTLLLKGRLREALREMLRRGELRGAPVHASVLSLLNALVLAPVRGALRARRLPSEQLGSWAGPSLLDLHLDAVTQVQRYHGSSSVRDLSLRELLDTSMPHQLHSEDRNSMLHSVESRLPFMDYRLVELGLALPDGFMLRNGETKAVLRDGLRGILPEAVRNRHDKVGFPAPESAWLRQNASLVRHELAEAVERFPAFLRPDLLRDFSAMQSGQSPYDGLFFRIVSLNRWAATYDAPPDARWRDPVATSAEQLAD